MSMVTPEISQVLTQMRVLQAQAQSSVAQPAAEVQSTTSFSDILNQSINSVNEVLKNLDVSKLLLKWVIQTLVLLKL